MPKWNIQQIRSTRAGTAFLDREAKLRRNADSASVGCDGGVVAAQEVSPQPKRTRPAFKQPRAPKYSYSVVKAFFAECGLPEPMFELKFHPERKWRFDVAFPAARVALEVQGGLFVNGRHNRGAALVKEHEKLNNAAALGWSVLYVLPADLCMTETVDLIKSTIQNKQCTHTKNELTSTSSTAEPTSTPPST